MHHGERWLLTIQSTYGMHSPASHLSEKQLISRLQTDRNQFSNNQTESGRKIWGDRLTGDGRRMQSRIVDM